MDGRGFCFCMRSAGAKTAVRLIAGFDRCQLLRRSYQPDAIEHVFCPAQQGFVRPLNVPDNMRREMLEERGFHFMGVVCSVLF